MTAVVRLLDQLEYTVMAPVPVSYTHLDVYKRQVYSFSYLRMNLHRNGKTNVRLHHRLVRKLWRFSCTNRGLRQLLCNILNGVYKTFILLHITSLIFVYLIPQLLE